LGRFYYFFASYAKKDNTKDSSISVDKDSITVAANGGSSTIAVSMNGSLWVVASDQT